jgi:hypothetical protein
MAYLQGYLHMDRSYNWRWYITDLSCNPVAESTNAYFTLSEANAAMELFLSSLKT